MDESRNNKIDRVLGLYSSLLNGEVIKKEEAAKRYGVNTRSVQRDIDDIRSFLENNAAQTGYVNSVIYDRAKKGYRLDQIYNLKLTNPEVLATCKIILDSRAFTKNEMTSMIEKLISCCVPKENQATVTDLIRNELYHYVPPHHNSEFLDRMWSIGQAIRKRQIIEVEYKRLDGKTNERRIEPLAICFSEFYFYVVGYIEYLQDDSSYRRKDSPYPTIFRIDRILKLTVLDDHYKEPYGSRFEEGEFRKRIQFMYGGKLRRITFEYTGMSIESVLDRLPTAEILSENDGKYIIRAEVFGNGIDMWIRSQGNAVKLL